MSAPSNPYRHDYHPMMESATTYADEVRQQAPGLSATILDDLLRDAYLSGRQAGEADGLRAQAEQLPKAYDEGYLRGHGDGQSEYKQWTHANAWNQLETIRGSLEQRVLLAPKSTIAKDRAVAEGIFDRLTKLADTVFSGPGSR